jgi:D-3-phosphoglycerate dehydrogenase
MKILISDNLSPKAVEIFKSAKGIDVDVKTKWEPGELKTVINQYDGLAVRSATKVTAEIIAAAEKLKVVGRAGSGLDNIDLAAATKRGIVVMNTPGGNTITTAEHTISLLLSLARKLPQATASLKGKKWEKSKFMGTEVYNHTLGIIGIGQIGSVVADRAKGLKMNVIAYDPFISPEKASMLGIELVTLDELYRRSDFITVHTPLTNETRNLIDADAFKKMKNKVLIINCARGGIINEKALYEAIKSGKVVGAALDVFEKEPPEDYSLVELDEVICTPHLGAATEEAQENVAIAIAEQMVDYLIHGIVRNAANVPSVSSDLLPLVKPYLTLAEKMGSLQAQIQAGAIEEVSVEYSGEVATLEVAPVTVALLKGLLSPILLESVNYVNAPIVAKERGIKVVESKSSRAEDFTTLITLKVKTDREKNILAGTIFGKYDPWIVRINQFRLEALPEGYMLLLYTHDRPGVIGNIGTTLGVNGINISRMQFGREEVEGKALVLLNTDSQVPQEVVRKIEKLPNVLSVAQLKV